MTALRTAAQQALEALEAGPDVDPIFAGETEDALRAALAESGRKPLTEDEILSLFRTSGSPVLFARAIEDKHGIGGAPEERHFCPRCGKRTQDIHTCTPPGDSDVHR